MKALLIVVAMALPAVAAETPAPATGEPTFRARLYERYCDKLRESPVAYVQFVRRLKPVHGFTYTDFAPPPGVPAVADCKVSAERLAAVSQAIAQPQR